MIVQPAGKLLLVEDDPQIRIQLQELLSERYQLDVASTAEQALQLALQHSYALLLLDIRLPDMDGLQLLKVLRPARQLPVIIVSACGAESDRISGFLHGADDYLAKPFSGTELLLRIEAVLRRCQLQPLNQADQLHWQGLRWDEQHSWFQHEMLPLTPLEHKLLGHLLRANGSVLPKRVLYPLVFNRPCTEHDRSLDMHISRLRKKLTAAGFTAGQLQTVHGKGYLLC